jgi:adenosylcobinamide-GDP ribazoletransferase
VDPTRTRPFRAAAWLADLRRAGQLLTRIPLPDDAAPPEPGALARALRVFPLVGALIGLVSGLVLVAASHLGLPGAVAALLALATGLLLTGALHEDGLADTADGFGVRRSAAERLAIMRDSRIGTYGVLALGLVVALKASALASLEPWTACAALAASAAASRATFPVLALILPPARSDGLGARMGRPSASTAAIAIAIGTAAALASLGPGPGAAALLAAAAAFAALAWLARRQVGGYTGDILGATQQVTETAMLLAVAASPWAANPWTV